MGADGVLLATPERRRADARRYPVQAVDATGAGDTFCGSFLARYPRRHARGGRPLCRVAAALKCGGYGAVARSRSLAEVRAALGGHAGLTCGDKLPDASLGGRHGMSSRGIGTVRGVVVVGDVLRPDAQGRTGGTDRRDAVAVQRRQASDRAATRACRSRHRCRHVAPPLADWLAQQRPPATADAWWAAHYAECRSRAIPAR